MFGRVLGKMVKPEGELSDQQMDDLSQFQENPKAQQTK